MSGHSVSFAERRTLASGRGTSVPALLSRSCCRRC